MSGETVRRRLGVKNPVHDKQPFREEWLRRQCGDVGSYLIRFDHALSGSPRHFGTKIWWSSFCASQPGQHASRKREGLGQVWVVEMGPEPSTAWVPEVAEKEANDWARDGTSTRYLTVCPPSPRLACSR